MPVLITQLATIYNEINSTAVMITACPAARVVRFVVSALLTLWLFWGQVNVPRLCYSPFRGDLCGLTGLCGRVDGFAFEAELPQHAELSESIGEVFANRSRIGCLAGPQKKNKGGLFSTANHHYHQQRILSRSSIHMVFQKLLNFSRRVAIQPPAAATTPFPVASWKV